MATMPNIIAISPIRTFEAEHDWECLCHIKDVLWARNKQVVQIQPKPEDEVSDIEFSRAMKASLNDILMADAVVHMPQHEMCPDVLLRLNVARSLGCAVVAWNDEAGEKLSEMF